jgi:hypothetical protein
MSATPRRFVAEEMESPMQSMKSFLVVWLSGLVTGLIVMESLRRLGHPDDPTAERQGDVTATGTASQASADKPKGLKLIVAGATAEAERGRQVLSQLMPWPKNSAAPNTGSASPS